MNKDSIKMLIAEYQRDASKDELVDRKYSIEDGLNYVFVGLRRAGKSCLMFRQIQQLLATGHSRDEILYFNFEDDRLTELDAPLLDSIKVCYEEMFDCRPIFFLDEIQIVSGWEKFARRLADQGYRVFITGSNAKMLSSEIATTLGGRYMIQQVWPFSFEEFLTASNIPISDSNAIYTHRNSIIKTFETYFQFGGLPEVARITGKRQWLGNLYQKLFFGDLIARHQIRNDFSLRVLIRKLAESIRQPSSFNRLANVTSAAGKKISTDTVIDYLSFLKESWLIFFVENFYAKLADKTRNQKYYFTDNGLLNLFLMDPKSSLLENLVAIQLKRLHGDEVYFYHNGIEVDFYLPITQTAIQVCYTLEDMQTRKRECGALLHLADRLPVEKMLIISKDEEEIIQLEDRTIEVTPLWKWLLGTVG